MAQVTYGHGSCSAQMTMASARVESWAAHRAWLPGVASHVAPAGSQTCMVATVQQQNLANSIALGGRFHQVDDHARAQWQQVTDERRRSG
jgi:hypothetical protein